MRWLLLIAFAAGLPITGAAQDSVPDLKGTWTGIFKSVVYGQNIHHPGDESVADPPRLREVPFTYEIEGQDGRALWGTTWSDPNQKDATAWAISLDGNIFGADSDGFHRLTVISEDRMEACFVMNGQSPTGAIVAGCAILERQRP